MPAAVPQGPDGVPVGQVVPALGREQSPPRAKPVASGEASILTPHRREICYVFADLRGFTTFTDSAEPEEVQAVLHEYHTAMGAVITAHEGTLDRFAGDGILIFFNDPFPTPEPAKRAARMALAMHEALGPLRARWAKLGYELDLGIGIAQGFATLGGLRLRGPRRLHGDRRRRQSRPPAVQQGELRGSADRP